MNTAEKIKEVLESGAQVTNSDIARLCGCTRSRVQQVMNSRGWKAPLDGRKAAVKKAMGREGMIPPVVTGGIPENVGLCAGAQITELLVTADLMARGYRVFTPVSRVSVYDLIAVDPKTGNVKKIEVKTGKRSESGKPYYQRNKSHKSRNAPATDGHSSAPDHYAVIIRGEPAIYDPPLP